MLRYFPTLLAILITNLCLGQQLQVLQSIASEKEIVLQKPELVYTAQDKVDEIGPDYFGEIIPSNYEVNASSNWIKTQDGLYIIKWEFNSEDATSINFMLENVALSSNAKIYTYNPENPAYTITYTADKIAKSNTLNTFPIKGKKQVLMLVTDQPQKEKFNVKNVVYGTKEADSFGESGSCNINANCADANGYRDQQKAVAIILVGGNGHCSGTLVNNTTNDKTPYIITAAHCIGSNTNQVTSWSFGFGFESPDCSNQNATPTVYSGSELRVLVPTGNGNDAALVEMDQKPDPSLVYYAGWDYSENVPTSVRGFHHPSGDIKKFSEDNGGIVKDRYLGQANQFFTWKTVWDKGTTEGGSSGSSLLNPQGRVIGTLTGGRASCSNPTGADYYAPLDQMFEYAPQNNSSSYAPWLDPSFAGNPTLDGLNPTATKPENDIAISKIENLDREICSSNKSIQPIIQVYNAGSSVISTYKITIADKNNPQTIFSEKNISSNLDPEDYEDITMDAFNINSNVTISVSIEIFNKTDARTYNNLAEFPITFTEGKTYSMVVDLDSYGSENSWVIKNNANEVVFESGTLPDSRDDLVLTTELCLAPNQCYKLEFEDTFGDGLSGDNGDSEGYYELRDENGSLVAEGWNTAPGAPGTTITETHNFCTSNVSIAETNRAALLQIFPNPVGNNKVLNYNLQHVNTVGETLYRIINPVGQVMLAGIAKENAGSISTQNLANGLYIIEFSDNKGSFQQRFVVQ